MTVVVDASAVLALLKNETGADVVAPVARAALLSAVNLIEVRSKLIDAVSDIDAAMGLLSRFEISTVPLTSAQATIAADLWPVVKGRNVSLADRACLALGIERRATVLTGDRRWIELGLSLDIRLIR